MKFKHEINILKLEQRLRRLRQLKAKNAPSLIIFNEVLLVNEACIDVANDIAKFLIEVKFSKNGR